MAMRRRVNTGGTAKRTEITPNEGHITEAPISTTNPAPAKARAMIRAGVGSSIECRVISLEDHLDPIVVTMMKLPAGETDGNHFWRSLTPTYHRPLPLSHVALMTSLSAEELLRSAVRLQLAGMLRLDAPDFERSGATSKTDETLILSRFRVQLHEINWMPGFTATVDELYERFIQYEVPLAQSPTLDDITLRDVINM